MSQEIWIVQMEDKKLVFIGAKRALESGKINVSNAEVLARFIANYDGKDLKVIDGHQASGLIHTHQFVVCNTTPAAVPMQSPVKPLQDRKNQS